MKISVNLIENENEYIANCPELDVNCYACTKNDAIRRIQSVIDFYIESAKEFGLDVENMSEIFVDGKKNRDFNSGRIITISESIN